MDVVRRGTLKKVLFKYTTGRGDVDKHYEESHKEDEKMENKKGKEEAK